MVSLTIKFDQLRIINRGINEKRMQSKVTESCLGNLDSKSQVAPISTTRLPLNDRVSHADITNVSFTAIQALPEKHILIFSSQVAVLDRSVIEAGQAKLGKLFTKYQQLVTIHEAEK